VSVAHRWLDEAHNLADRESERIAYAKYLKSYGQAENGMWNKQRNCRGSLTNDWEAKDLYGKSVLVVGEDRIGDEVLTIGCLPSDVRSYASISWKCDNKVSTLFTRSFPTVKFFSQGDPQPINAGTIYSWELVERFRKHLGDFPWLRDGMEFTPYLTPLTHLRDELYSHYHHGSKKVIGLAWRSERDGNLLSDKSCDLCVVPHWDAFFQQFKDKVRFISLPYGDTQDDIEFARSKYGVEIYQDNSIDIYNDLDAAAAQVAAVDYVIAISTTTVHLAGALAIPGWVLLAASPFGHWRAGVSLSPWYPTLRPIKQISRGDWKNVLEDVSKALETELEALKQ
jgi:hypothetical protein